MSERVRHCVPVPLISIMRYVRLPVEGDLNGAQDCRSFCLRVRFERCSARPTLPCAARDNLSRPMQAVHPLGYRTKSGHRNFGGHVGRRLGSPLRRECYHVACVMRSCLGYVCGCGQKTDYGLSVNILALRVFVDTAL